MEFYGYRRPDGRVGVRNKVLILPASVCASDTTRIIAQQVTGSVTFNNQQGCAQVAPDQQLTMDVMAGYAANPQYLRARWWCLWAVRTARWIWWWTPFASAPTSRSSR